MKNHEKHSARLVHCRIAAVAAISAWLSPDEGACVFEAQQQYAAIRFQGQLVTLDLHMEEIRMNIQVEKLVGAGSFGIAFLGLYFIVNSTSTHLSLSACAMYIVGTVAGVILMQSK
jgi:hypothetical protein